MKSKLLGWAILGFLIFYAVTDPTGAAHGTRHAINGLGHLAHGLGAFISALAGGQ